MEKIPVQKIARVLYVLVVVALVCNVIALYLVPEVVWHGRIGLPDGMQIYVNGNALMGEIGKHRLLTYFVGGAALWIVGWWNYFDTYQIVLTLFLLFSGCCTAVILWQARRVLNTILRGEPFALENAVSRVEPALVLACSLLVGLILLSVMLPLMNIMAAIG